MSDLERVKRNIKKLIKANADEEDIDAYIKSEGYSIEDIKRSGAENVALSIGGGFNRGILNTIGGIVDMASDAYKGFFESAPDYIPRPKIGDPVGGKKWLYEKTPEALIGNKNKELPEPFLARISEEFGMASVPVGALGALARTGVKGGKALGPMLESIRKAPRSSAAAESASTLGAGVGAAIANQIAPDNPYAEMTGQIAGGVLSPFAIGIEKGPAAYAGAKRALSPWLPGGAKRQAANELSGVVADKEKAIEILSRPQNAVPGAQLSPAQETRDIGLQRMESSFERAKPEVSMKLSKMEEETRKAVEREAKYISSTSPELTRDFLEERLTKIKDKMESRVEQAMLNARNRIESVSNEIEPADASKIVREEIEKSYGKAKIDNKNKWKKVNENIEIDIDPLFKEYENAKKSLKKIESMPETIEIAFGKEGIMGKIEDGERISKETLGELQSLRSRILRDIRNEQSGDIAPDERKISILNKFEDLILDVMQKADTSKALQEAIADTRIMKQTFRSGPIGEVLTIGKGNRPKVPPEKTLESVLSPAGVSEALGFDDLMKAVNGSPASKKAAEEFLKEKFIRSATDVNGKVSPTAARRFLKSHGEILNRIPSLKKELENAKSAQMMAEKISKMMKIREKNLYSKQKSRASLYLNGPVNREISAIINSRKPVENMREIVKQVKKDKYALKGLQSQFIEEMFSRGKNADTLDDFLNSNKDVIRRTGLFNKDEIQRIELIRRTIDDLERGALRGNLEQVLNDTPSAIVDLLSRMTGSNMAKLSPAGNTLIAQAAGSRFVRNITEKIPMNKTREILAQAVTDRKLMVELLKRVKTKEEAARVLNRIHPWIAGLLPDKSEEIEDQ